MSCFFPNYAQRVKGSGDVPHLIRPYGTYGDTDTFEINTLLTDGYVGIVDGKMAEFETFIVPCGKCVGCRLDYSREWADRCYLESLSKSPNWFITLTYDYLNLPVTEFLKGDEVIYTNSLVKDHLSGFLKRLRRYYDYHYNLQGFSFYGCGEYGSRYQRPHYHLLLFGVPIEDLELFTYKDGFATYNSKIFSDCWNKGFVTINEFTWETASYVARYCLKKQYGEEKQFYLDMGLTPEFSLMSRNPGIGYDYYLKHRDEIFERGYIPVKKASGVFHSPIPKYFQRCYEKDCPDFFQIWYNNKHTESIDRFINNYLLSDNDLSMIEQRGVNERTKLASIKALRRNFESNFNII